MPLSNRIRQVAEQQEDMSLEIEEEESQPVADEEVADVEEGMPPILDDAISEAEYLAELAEAARQVADEKVQQAAEVFGTDEDDAPPEVGGKTIDAGAEKAKPILMTQKNSC